LNGPYSEKLRFFFLIPCDSGIWASVTWQWWFGYFGSSQLRSKYVVGFKSVQNDPKNKHLGSTDLKKLNLALLWWC